MALHVALNHRTEYVYDRLTGLGPQVVRLRPAPHSRTPILSYSLNITPKEHFINWQQDPFGNYLARLVFLEPTREFKVEVDLVADMATINPFDFFVDDYARDFPFKYEPELKEELAPYLRASEPGPLLKDYLSKLYFDVKTSLDFIWALNGQLQHDVKYLIRLEPGVQTPEETLQKKSGSCRDSAWLLVHILRNYGLAARFVSGYLIQLRADVKSLDGPSGTEHDFTDLHAWAEVYLPGAGWIGLDPTSGLFAGEGHIPLAATPSPQSAAPISGEHEEAQVDFTFAMRSRASWKALASRCPTPRSNGARLRRPGMRWTGALWPATCAFRWAASRPSSPSTTWTARNGIPTRSGQPSASMPKISSAACVTSSRRAASSIMGRASGIPASSCRAGRLRCYWRADGQPLWKMKQLHRSSKCPPIRAATVDDAEAASQPTLAEAARPSRRQRSSPAYEDPAHFLSSEQKLPLNLDPANQQARPIPQERAACHTPRCSSAASRKPSGLRDADPGLA